MVTDECVWSKLVKGAFKDENKGNGKRESSINS
jgi:hypothetical protein